MLEKEEKQQKKKNRGGRKALPESEKKQNHRVTLLFNDKEFSDLYKKYPLKKGTQGPILKTILLNSKNVNKIVNDKEYKKLMVQTNRISVNLNQITKKLYSSNSLEIQNLEEVLKDLKSSQDEIIRFLM